MNAETLTIETRLGVMRLAATSAGLCKIALGNETPESFENWLARHIHDGPAQPEQAQNLLRRAAAQLEAYLAGQRRSFDLSLDMRGTAFQQSVWHQVAAIPYGQTRTYGQIAAQVGRPQASRAVGAANGANPLPVIIACHRVIGSDGALRGYGGGLDIKASLLALEADLAPVQRIPA